MDKNNAKCLLCLLTKMKQAEGQSEASKRREILMKMEQLRAEISHLDSQISGSEEQLAAQGQSMSSCVSLALLAIYHSLIFKSLTGGCALTTV